MASPFADDPFLEELLRTGSVSASAAGASRAPIPERDLLRAANAAGTPTLRGMATHQAEAAAGTFSNEVVALVRKHPLPAVAAAASIAFLLTRRRR